MIGPGAELWAVDFAHRGLHGRDSGAVENSLAAFRAAIDSGYGIELDVRLTADREVVVFHDESLDRMTGHPGRLIEMSADAIGEVPLVGGERIPLLSGALALVGGRVPVLVEMKVEDSNPAAASLTAALAEETARLVDAYAGVVAVNSFSADAVRAARRASPNLVTGRVYRANEPVEPDGADCFAVCNRAGLPAESAAKARAAGMAILAWTVGDPAEAQRLRRHVDAIVFEGFRASRS